MLKVLVIVSLWGGGQKCEIIFALTRCLEEVHDEVVLRGGLQGHEVHTVLPAHVTPVQPVNLQHRRYSTVQYSTVQYNSVQYKTVQCSTVQYFRHMLRTSTQSTCNIDSTVTVHYSIIQYIVVQYSTVWYVRFFPC